MAHMTHQHEYSLSNCLHCKVSFILVLGPDDTRTVMKQINLADVS